MTYYAPTPSENLYPPSTYPTSTDLSAYAGYGAVLTNGLAVVNASQGARPKGVIRQSTPSNAAHGVELVNTPGQQVLCVAGANGVSAKGVEVTQAADGRWEDAASNDVVIGESDRAAAEGEWFVCYLGHQYTKA